jgi:Protein kinase domain
MIGARLGSWVIDKELGRGGMGRVFLAHEEATGKQSAIKVLAAELAQDPGFLHRFQREIDALSQLSHPNIVRFYEAGFQDNIYYYSMEFVEGRNFEELLHEQGRLPWKEVLDAALQICPALKHAHDRGIIHRDLKPPNLMRTADGLVKLTDFGIAKVFSSTQLTATGGVVGTAEYLSPEQAAGKPVTKRSDLYSLGVVLYTLLTGRTPFEGVSFVDLLHKHRFGQFDRPQKLVPELPYELDEVVCQLLEKDPGQRPADGLVLQRLLESVRRKLERKANQTMAPDKQEHTLADNAGARLAGNGGEGPATLMSRLMRQELDRQNRGGPVTQFFNRPWVLVPLFLLCVGLIVWGFWPRDDSDRDQPGTGSPAAAGPSEAERIYQAGLRHEKEGDLGAAQRDWEDVVRIFQGIETEKKWVENARDRLKELRQKANGKRWASVHAALERARKLHKENKRNEAARIWNAIEERYGQDPYAKAIIEEMRNDRGK